MAAKGASWFAGPFERNIYVVGVDTNIPPSVLTDPEVIVVLSEHNPVLLFGTGQQVSNIPCLANLPLAFHPSTPIHDHGDGSPVLEVDCDTG